MWVLVEMKVQDVIGHADWGMYAALLSFGFLFITLADLGVNYFATKTLAGQPELMRSYFPNLLTFKIFITLLYPFVMVVAGWILGYGERELYMLLLLCLVHGAGQILQFFRANFQAMQRFRIDGIFSVLDRLVLLIIVGVLFVTKMDIDSFVYGRLIAIGVSVLICYLVLLKLYGWMAPQLDRALISKIVKQSLPFAMMTVLYSIHDKVDQVMLERMAGETANGLYVAAYRWLDAFSMYLWTVLPIFFARFAFFIDDIKEQERLLHFGQVIASLPLIFVSVFVFFYGEQLLFLYDNSTTEELDVMRSCLQALFGAALLNAVFAIFSTLLTSTGYERYVNRMVAVAIVLNIVLNAIFIPEYGAIACAWSTLVSYAVMDVAYVIYIFRNLDIQVPWSQMVRLFLLAGGLAGLMYGLDLAGLSWLWVTAISGLAFVGGIFGLKLLTMEQIRGFRVKS